MDDDQRPRATNSVSDTKAETIVQSDRMGDVTVSHRDPRAFALLAATLVVVVASAASIVWMLRPQEVNSATTTSEVVAPSLTTEMPDAPTSAAVHVDSVQYIGVPTVGNSFAFPHALNLGKAELDRLSAAGSDYPRRARELGGVGPGDVAVQISLRGMATETAVITDMRAIAQCRAPLTGALLYSPPAGQDTSPQIGFDLDQPSPLPQNYEVGQLSGNYFLGHTISIKPDETHTLVVHGMTNRQYCRFKLEITVNTGLNNKPVTQIIDDYGKDFEVTSIASADPAHPGPRFSDYREIYAGGVVAPARDTKFAPVDPATYEGS